MIQQQTKEQHTNEGEEVEKESEEKQNEHKEDGISSKLISEEDFGKFISQVNELKQKGNELFVKKQYEEAETIYQQCIQILSANELFRDESSSEVKKQTEQEKSVGDEQGANVNVVDNDSDSVTQKIHSNTNSNFKPEGKQQEDGSLDESHKHSGIDKWVNERNGIEVTIRSNIAACLLHLGHYEKVVSECSRSLELDRNHLKSLYRRAKAFEALEKYEEAIQDFQNILNQPESSGFNLNQIESTMNHLKDLRKKQQEEEMKKMWSQLKDLGNSILGNFGINLDNLNIKKDENSGSYSINFGNEPKK